MNEKVHKKLWEFIEELYRKPYVAEDVLADLKKLKKHFKVMIKEFKWQMKRGFKGND